VTHPLEQLAPYVDGTLPPSERGAVDEHLRACSRCREQVRAAGLARAALRSLESPPGPDIAAGFGPERAAEVASPRTSSSPRWTKVAAGLAAAAVVAAVALVVPRLGTSSDDAGSAALGAADAGTDATEGPLRLELDGTAYDAASIEQAAADAAAEVARGETEAEAGGAETGGAEAPAEDAASAAPEQTRFAGPGRTDEAIACLERAFPGFPGELVRVKRATFEGSPAYLGFVLEGPGAGTPADTLSIWVASVEDCEILSISSARL
jgi:anti-sigma factor RsiW